MDSKELYLVATMLRVQAQSAQQSCIYSKHTRHGREKTMDDAVWNPSEHIIGNHLVMLSVVIMFRPIQYVKIDMRQTDIGEG